MNDSRSAEARVKAGAELLDAMNPGWFTKISLQKLQMSDPCQCVIGQLYETYSLGLSALEIDVSFERDIEYGFDFYIGTASLTAHWHREIEARLAADAPPIFSSEPHTDGRWDRYVPGKGWIEPRRTE